MLKQEIMQVGGGEAQGEMLRKLFSVAVGSMSSSELAEQECGLRNQFKANDLFCGVVDEIWCGMPGYRKKIMSGLVEGRK